MEIIKATTMKRDNDWRIMLYAKPGVGKTSAIRHLQGKTLVLDMDDSSKVLAGEENIDVMKFDRVNANACMNDFLRMGPELSKQYDNIVIDNISSFERDWFVELGKTSKNGISNEIQDYSKWTNYFARVMTTIYMWQGVNILVTAWEMLEDANEDGVNFKRYAPRVRDSVRDGLLGLTDVVGRVVINPKTSGRGVILEGNDTLYAKNRLDNRKVCSIEELFTIGDVIEHAD